MHITAGVAVGLYAGACLRVSCTLFLLLVVVCLLSFSLSCRVFVLLLDEYSRPCSTRYAVWSPLQVEPARICTCCYMAQHSQSLEDSSPTSPGQTATNSTKQQE